MYLWLKSTRWLAGARHNALLLSADGATWTNETGEVVATRVDGQWTSVDKPLAGIASAQLAITKTRAQQWIGRLNEDFATAERRVARQKAKAELRAATTPKRGARWTADEDAQLIEMHRNGVDGVKIARQFGRTLSGVYVRLGVLGAK